MAAGTPENRVALTTSSGYCLHIGPSFITPEHVGLLFGMTSPVIIRRGASEDEMDIIDLDAQFDASLLDCGAPVGTYVVVDEAQADAEVIAEPDADRLESVRREFIEARYRPLRPDLMVFDKAHFLVPTLVDALADGSDEALQSAARKLSETGVYSVRMFSEAFCAGLLDELDHFEATGLPCVRPNSMNRFGLVLDDIGFAPMLDALMRQVVLPFARLFYPAYVGEGADGLDSHHGFIVQYRMDEDRELGFHYDASEVTLNVCLGREFTGGQLYFRGLLLDPSTHEEHETIEHVAGAGVLHIGRHRHGAKPLLSGERYNLILWCRSTAKHFCASCLQYHHSHTEHTDNGFHS